MQPPAMASIIIIGKPIVIVGIKKYVKTFSKGYTSEAKKTNAHKGEVAQKKI